MTDFLTTPAQRARLKNSQDFASCSAILVHTVAEMTRLFGPVATLGALIGCAEAQVTLLTPPAPSPPAHPDPARENDNTENDFA